MNVKGGCAKKGRNKIQLPLLSSPYQSSPLKGPLDGGLISRAPKGPLLSSPYQSSPLKGPLDGGLISRAPKGDGGLNSRAC